MNGSLSSLLAESQSVVVILPRNPNFDTVAAGTSLYESLREQKQVTAYCPTPMLVQFNRLVGVNRVKNEIGNKNLIIGFKNYQATDIERVSYDIVNSEFKLTVIPKDSSLPPTEEQVDIGYGGVSADLAIIVGGQSIQDFPIVADELKDAKIIHVGMSSISGAGASEIISLAIPAESNSGSVWKLLKESGINVGIDVASNLLSGIEDETQDFASTNTTADTFQAVSDLMRLGGKRRSKVTEGQNMSGAGSTQDPFGRINMQPRQKPITTKRPLPQEQKEGAKETGGQPPKTWFGPKIYKGTTVS